MTKPTLPPLPKVTYQFLADNFGPEAANLLCITRWKDGIDIEVPSPGVQEGFEAYARQAIAQAPIQAVTPGYQLVPIEPTLEMKQAMHATKKRKKSYEGDKGRESWFEQPERMYKAALSAAPEPAIAQPDMCNASGYEKGKAGVSCGTCQPATPERTMREAFEVWANNRHFENFKCNTGGFYVDEVLQHAWAGWQAASAVGPAERKLLTDDLIDEIFERVASLHPVPVNGKNIVFSTLVGGDEGREFARAIEYAIIAGAPQTEPVERKPLTEPEIESIAVVIAGHFDYPWQYMPENGKESVRELAKTVVNIALGIPAPVAETPK